METRTDTLLGLLGRSYRLFPPGCAYRERLKAGSNRLPPRGGHEVSKLAVRYEAIVVAVISEWL
ncbi:hypothetical protein [Streptomyces sp. NPDC046182]|uniref:hypothetical protein n=1 Tax=Streptomyces sp. NPDC046182 TaxID=3154601 RepID=UPI0033D34839